MNRSTGLPLVSCLCVTRERPHHLRRAIACFEVQTHPNRELVIVCPPWDHATQECVAAAGGSRTRLFLVDPQGRTLGDIRNASLEFAAGEYFCVWDDDDWYSPDRLALQLAAIERHRKPVTVLERLVIFDARDSSAHLGCERLWENSLFAHRETLASRGLRYPPMDRSEDYELVNQLVDANLVYPLLEPTLYVYHANGGNVSGAAHFELLRRRSAPLGTAASEIVARAMRLELSPIRAHEQMLSQQFLESFEFIRRSSLRRM